MRRRSAISLSDSRSASRPSTSSFALAERLNDFVVQLVGRSDGDGVARIQRKGSKQATNIVGCHAFTCQRIEQVGHLRSQIDKGTHKGLRLRQLEGIRQGVQCQCLLPLRLVSQCQEWRSPQSAASADDNARSARRLAAADQRPRRGWRGWPALPVGGRMSVRAVRSTGTGSWGQHRYTTAGRLAARAQHHAAAPAGTAASGQRQQNRLTASHWRG